MSKLQPAVSTFTGSPSRRTHCLISVLILLPLSYALASAQTFTSVYSFTNTSSSGAYPGGGVVLDSAGNLYGTTANGGLEYDGTVFKIDTAGNETVLHSFAPDGTDGFNPQASLILDSAGNAYGTTSSGGSDDFGTVFEVNPSGSETVLHSFVSNNTDGLLPQASLIRDSAGNLYGTTGIGGSSDAGTVFKVDPSGNETVLHSFDITDGDSPLAGLVLDSAGNLYGTTGYGGLNFEGTVFKLDSSGNFTVLHNFNNADGALPDSSLALDSAGNLYGTTVYGGEYGYGAVFKLDSSGNLTVLHSFNVADGEYPESGVALDSAGNVYGTAGAGGADGVGAIFKIDSSGNFTLLHSFNNSDGAYPLGNLVFDSAGNLYGTTNGGGSDGFGTVFKVTFATPFASFSPSLSVHGHNAGFEFNANFALGSGATALDLSTQTFTLAIGSYTLSLPPGSFQPFASKSFEYSGTVNGVALTIRIDPTGAQGYTIQVHAMGIGLSNLSSPAPVSLTIGNNTGNANVSF